MYKNNSDKIVLGYMWCMLISVQRTLTEQQRASLTSDFECLNLTRYIGEAVSGKIDLLLGENVLCIGVCLFCVIQATGIAEAKIKVCFSTTIKHYRAGNL